MADANALDRGVPVPSEPGRPADPQPQPPAVRADGEDHVARRPPVGASEPARPVILAVLVGDAPSASGSPRTIRDILIAPLPNDLEVQVLGSATASSSSSRSPSSTGIILAMPVMLYQLWAFVAPGLTDAEKRAIRPWVPLALLFFALGVASPRFVLPFAIAVPALVHR